MQGFPLSHLFLVILFFLDFFFVARLLLFFPAQSFICYEMIFKHNLRFVVTRLIIRWIESILLNAFLFCPKMSLSSLVFFVGFNRSCCTCEVLCHHWKSLSCLKLKIDETFSLLCRKLWKERKFKPNSPSRRRYTNMRLLKRQSKQFQVLCTA